MTEHHFDGDVRLAVGGDAALDRRHVCDLAFGSGDVAYLRSSARRGFMEKVVVKFARRLDGYGRIYTPYSGGCPARSLYTDTLNAVHEESDFLSRQEALELIYRLG